MKIDGVTVAETTDWKPDLFPKRHSGESKKNVLLKDLFIYSKVIRILLVILLSLSLAVLCPYIINRQLSFAPADKRVSGTCHIQFGMRANCFPELSKFQEVNQSMCLARGCCYQELNIEQGGPVCHRKLPSVHTLNVTLVGGNGTDGDLVTAFPAVSDAWPGPQLNDLRYMIRQMKTGHIRIVMYGKDNVPSQEMGSGTNITDPVDIRLSLDNVNDLRLGLRISRRPENISILDASYGSVFVTEKYSEVSLALPTGVLYGLGGHPLSFNATGNNYGTNFTKKLFFNADPELMENQQHSIPFFITMDPGQQYSGILVEVGGSPLEVEAMPGFDRMVDLDTQNQFPANRKPMLVFRSMSNFIALHLFVGPTPKDVVSQLSGFIGKQKMPPLWATGLSICRQTLDERTDLADFRNNLANMKKNNISFDSDCLSGNLLESAFNIWSKIDPSTSLDDLVADGKKFVLVSPPHVDNKTAVEGGAYIRNEFDNESFVSMIGDKIEVLLPDFEEATVEEWLKQNLEKLLLKFNHKPSGINLVRNAPYVKSLLPSSSTSSSLSTCNNTNLPFIPSGAFKHSRTGISTVCPNAVQSSGKHYSSHNTYSHKHFEVVQKSLNKLGHNSTFLLNSHSHSKNVQNVLGSDFQPSWENLGKSLREVLEMGMAGFRFVSMQACGKDSNNTVIDKSFVEELCLRWYQLSAYMPAIHASRGTETISRMPYSFTRTYVSWIKRALQQRIKLMPYIYGQMYTGAVNGLPLVRPLVMEFPDDINLHQRRVVWKQFMLGEAILVNPIIEPGVRLLEAYFPKVEWFELWSGFKFERSGQIAETESILAQIPAYIRGGQIIPLLDFQESDNPKSNIDGFTRFNHTLIVAFSCGQLGPRLQKQNCTASGSILAHFEDGVETSVEDYVMVSIFAYQTTTSASVTLGEEAITKPWRGCTGKANRYIQRVLVYGARESVKGSADGFNFDPDLKRLQIEGDLLDLCSQTKLSLEWNLL